MRLIDADVLMQNIPNEEMIAKMAVTHAPSIDIVRCKECIWFDTDNTGEGYCTYVKGLADAKADDFCSYGERSEP